MKSLIGIQASRSDVVIVELEYSSKDQVSCKSDTTVKLQDGERSKAYFNIKEYIKTNLVEKKPDLVVIKGSAVSGRGGATLGLLEAAELRGVVMSATVEANCEVQIVKKGSVSKTFGQRKVDGYVRDEDFWESKFSGTLRKGSREIALLSYSVLHD